MTEFDRTALGADFSLGIATSAYQIEGAVAEGGRGPSIWDRFCHTPGKVKHGHTGDMACDHYHRFEDDIRLLKWLGVDSYRFSIAWSRVLPLGRGAVNQTGLDFYDRLVDALLEAHVDPCVTLYHWDLPDAIDAYGGWLARDTTDAFADYAAVVAKRLGDRVGTWLTHNEPWCQAFLGYETGLFAPGHQDFNEALLCAHHLLLSHGKAVQALRSNTNAPVGIAPNFLPAHPASSAESDAAAARRLDGYFNRWFLDPLHGRGYPDDMRTLYGSRMPQFPTADLDIIAAPIDILGVNYYERAIVHQEPGAGLLELQHVRTDEYPRTEDREIYPQGLGELLRHLHVEYGPKRMTITENGAAFQDVLCADGHVHDQARIEFLRAHLQQVAMARQQGVPVDGFYVWSLLDNFEWSEGYSLRYGLIHVDFETQNRAPKDSAYFLRSLSRRQP